MLPRWGSTNLAAPAMKWPARKQDHNNHAKQNCATKAHIDASEEVNVNCDLFFLNHIYQVPDGVPISTRGITVGHCSGSSHQGSVRRGDGTTNQALCPGGKPKPTWPK